jgi:hypothetical protein
MPRERDEWPSRVKAIEREFSALRLAAARLLEAKGKGVSQRQRGQEPIHRFARIGS